MRAEWSHFFGFLKKPDLPTVASNNFHTGARAVSRVLVLDLCAMGVLMVVAGTVLALGIEIPETALAGIEITAGIAFAVVVIAPVMEEIAFRSWLSGRPRYLIAFPILLVGAIAAAMTAESTTGQTALTYTGGIVLGGLVLWLVLAAILWRRVAPQWFQTIFPALFWLSTAAFASIHLLNFSEGSIATLLPLIIPQFILGMLLGYLRVNYGLWTAIALHMIHNGLIIAFVTIAARASGS